MIETYLNVKDRMYEIYDILTLQDNVTDPSMWIEKINEYFPKKET